jgi:hypothetical protein
VFGDERADQLVRPEFGFDGGEQVLLLEFEVVHDFEVEAVENAAGLTFDGGGRGSASRARRTITPSARPLWCWCESGCRLLCRSIPGSGARVAAYSQTSAKGGGGTGELEHFS